MSARRHAHQHIRASEADNMTSSTQELRRIAGKSANPSTRTPRRIAAPAFCCKITADHNANWEISVLFAKLVRGFIFAFCVAIVATLPIAGKASAQTRIAVMGDSLAQDLWFGLRDLYGASGKRKFLKYTKASSGLVKRSFYNWNARSAQIAASNIQIAIVMVGGNDRQGFGGRARFSKGWRAAYRARVDQLNQTLKRRIGRVYWVGLPKVRSGRMSRDYRKLNAIYAASAAANGVHYINIWAWTSANQSLLRADGLHFTSRGMVALARRVGAAVF